MTPSVIFQSTRPNAGVRSHQKVLFETCYSVVESTNVAVSVFCDNPPFPLSAVLTAEQPLPSQVHIHEMLRIQEPSTIIPYREKQTWTLLTIL